MGISNSMQSKLDQALIDSESEAKTAELISSGANANATNRWGETALMMAKIAGQTDLLLKAGASASINAKNDYGCTALMMAKTADQSELLIYYGADVNATDKYGRTALMFAKIDQTSVLISAGADVNATNKKGVSSLMLAASASQKKLLEDAMKKSVYDPVSIAKIGSLSQRKT